MIRGKYIVLEGPEGVGKTTQLQELARRLQAAGLPVRLLREPDSQSDLTARAIRQLTQDPRYPMNTRTEVLLYNAARAQSLQVIKQSIEHGVICLVDRNYLTTLAIQYYGRGDVPDYQTINTIINFAVGGIEPDLCILLDAPVPVLRERLANRYQADRFDGLSDAFLERVRAGYLWEAHQRQLPVVFATDEPEKVADNIWQLASQALAIRDGNASTVAVDSGPTSVKEIIQQKNLPEPPVTQGTTQSAQTAMPANTAANNESNTSAIANMPPTRPADTIELNLEGVSYLAAPYFLQAAVTNIIPDATAEPASYYIPEDLPETVKTQYKQGMDKIFAAVNGMREQLAKHLGEDSENYAETLLQGLLPLATLMTVQITMPRSAAHELIIDLLGQELPEAQAIGESLLGQEAAEDGGEAGEVRQRIAARRTVMTGMKALAEKHLPDNHATQPETVTLLDFWPKNELLLVPNMLYEHSNQALELVQAEVNNWPYSRKADVFKAYFGQGSATPYLSGSALEKAHYSWEFCTDFITFLTVCRQTPVEDLSWQVPSPRYGYNMPEIIEQAGLTDQWEACFEISLQLHSYLQKAGQPAAAMYVTLLDHRLRWKGTYNGAQLLRLLQLGSWNKGVAVNGKGLTDQIREKLAEVHPLTAERLTSSSSK